MNLERCPLVSVLIPAYNHQRFVLRCLDSVLEDPYPAKEIVIIDDGSGDATAQRIAHWVLAHAGTLPIIYRRRPNRGIAATMNELVALARGRFLRLGASDDYLLPGGLQAQVRYLQLHPDKAAVIGDATVVDAQGRPVFASSMSQLHRADKSLYRSEAGLRRAIIGQFAVSGAVTLMRRSFFDARQGWNESLRIEDWDFFLRLVARDALGFIDTPVCAYRLHGHNVSKSRHVPTRIANLCESRRVALRGIAWFDGTERMLLKAQAHFIAAKIAFLRRRPCRLLYHLAGYAWMAWKSRGPRVPPVSLAEKA